MTAVQTYIQKVDDKTIADTLCDLCNKEDLVHWFEIEGYNEPENALVQSAFKGYACRDCANLYLNLNW